MRIHNLYTDANGQSHFRDIEVEWVEERPGGRLSRRLPATGIIFRETAGDYDLDWHPAPRSPSAASTCAGSSASATAARCSSPTPAAAASTRCSASSCEACRAQSKSSTLRATSPAFIARKASLMSSSRPRRVTISSSKSRP